MRLHSTRDGHLNGLLLPGGPGLGSKSLQELADAMIVAGSVWLVDLPGDGSNTVPANRDPFEEWPQVEAADAMTDAVFSREAFPMDRKSCRGDSRFRPILPLRPALRKDAFDTRSRDHPETIP